MKHLFKNKTTNEETICTKVVINEIEIDNICNNQLRFCGQKEDKELFGYCLGVKDGYNKSQQIHPFTEDDIISFAVWLNRNYSICDINSVCKNLFYEIGNICNGRYTVDDLLEKWKYLKSIN